MFDFCRELLNDPVNLHVLGNGKQRKSYMYIQDCLDALLIVNRQNYDGFNVFNLGTEGVIEVNDSIGWICEELGVKPKVTYAGGERGWVGDSPFIYLDTAKIRRLGWNPQLTIREGVKKTVKWLLENQWCLGRISEK